MNANKPLIDYIKELSLIIDQGIKVVSSIENRKVDLWYKGQALIKHLEEEEEKSGWTIETMHGRPIATRPIQKDDLDYLKICPDCNCEATKIILELRDFGKIMTNPHMRGYCGCSIGG